MAGNDIGEIILTRNDVGHIVAKTEVIEGVTFEYAYEYDDLGRLTVVRNVSGSELERYTYGPQGERLTETNDLRGIVSRSFTYDDEDRLLTGGGAEYEFDADGFLISKTNGSETTTYEYSSRGELKRVELPSGEVVEYRHDPMGRRVAKLVDGSVTEKYLWLGRTRLLAVYNGDDTLKSRFLYADARMPMGMVQDGETYYFAYDQVGSLRAVTNAAGSVVKTIRYDSFGNIVEDTNPELDVPFGFAGGLHDRDTGLVRFGHRDYDPDTGRWTAKDPIGFGGEDVALYGYAERDPISVINPGGLQSFCLPPYKETTSWEITNRGEPEWELKPPIFMAGNPFGYANWHKRTKIMKERDERERASCIVCDACGGNCDVKIVYGVWKHVSKYENEIEVISMPAYACNNDCDPTDWDVFWTNHPETGRSLWWDFTMMLNKFCILMFSTFSALFMTNLGEADAFDLNDFASPPSGYKYIYSCKEPCDSHVLIGGEAANSEIVVTEVIYFSQQAREDLPNIPESFSKQKKLRVRGDALLEIDHGNEFILIKKPINQGSTWTNDETTHRVYGNGTFSEEKLTWQCEVENIKKGKILSQTIDRDIISVKCVLSAPPMHAVIRRYASGVGLIEKKTVDLLSNKVLSSERLLRIEKCLDP